MKLLFESKTYECSDWINRDLGNQHKRKNEDSYLRHNLNKSLEVLKVDVLCSLDNKEFFNISDPIDLGRFGYVYMLDIIQIDLNTLQLSISAHKGVAIKEFPNKLKLTSEEGFYKIKIYEE